jgi:hypothetical protein
LEEDLRVEFTEDGMFEMLEDNTNTKKVKS